MSEQDKDQIPSDNYDREIATDLDDDTPDKPKGIALHTKILIGLLVGIGGGLIANMALGGANENVTWFISNFTQPVGTLFLNLLLMIVVPLVFSSPQSATLATSGKALSTPRCRERERELSARECALLFR